MISHNCIFLRNCSWFAQLILDAAQTCGSIALRQTPIQLCDSPAQVVKCFRGAELAKVIRTAA